MDILQLALDNGGSIVVVIDGSAYRVVVSRIGEMATQPPKSRPVSAPALPTGKRRGRPPKAKADDTQETPS